MSLGLIRPAYAKTRIIFPTTGIATRVGTATNFGINEHSQKHLLNIIMNYICRAVLGIHYKQ